MENLMYITILLKRIIFLPGDGWIYGTRKIIRFRLLNPEKYATVGKISMKIQAGLKFIQQTDMVTLPN